MIQTDPVQLVLQHLDGVKPAGKGQWQARCPVHDDAHASLSIGQGDKGVVLHCHAGCETSDILRTMRLSERDLFSSRAPRQLPVKSDRKLSASRPNAVYRSPEEAFAAAARQADVQFVAEWRYPGDTFRVGRFARPDGGKTFRPIHRVGTGWAAGDPAGILPLYRGDEIAAEGPIFICEGEKTCDAGWGVGLCAVTSSHGAGCAYKSDWSSLAGREVVILPDHDASGLKYAEEVAAILAKLDPPATVKVVDLPGLGKGDDLADLVTADGIWGCKTADEIRDIVLGMAQAAPAWTPTASTDDKQVVVPSFLSASELLAKYPTQREPVIDGLLRRGEVGNIISGPKLFKSWLLLHLALCVVQGRPVLGFPTKPGRVLLFDYEVPPGTLAKRLQVVMSAVGISAGALGDHLAIQSLRGRRLDIDAMDAYFNSLKPRQFDLIVIDPLYKAFPKRSDSARSFDENSNADMAELYGMLCGYAETMDAGLLVMHHLTKGDQSGKGVTDLGAGGGSQSRAADAHIAIRAHAEDNAAVLSGVVRSFPPFEPITMRWDFPLWRLAPDLDPNDLKRPPRRTPAPKPAAPEPPAEPPFDVNRFAGELLKDAPVSKAAIIAKANTVGINDHQANKFLDSAEAQGLAFRWKQPKDKRVYFANRQQPVLTAAVEPETHT